MSLWQFKKYKYLLRMLWQKAVFRAKIFFHTLGK